MQTEHQVARERLVTALLEGCTFQQASRDFPVPVKRAMAYRLLHAVRTQGPIALQDRRQGHPSKLRGAVRACLETSCRAAPYTPSSVVQTQLQERFDVKVSISQINRVRRQLGVSNPSKNGESGKNSSTGKTSLSRRVAGRSRKPPAYYIDGHRKAVYTDSLIPRGLVGRLEKVLGCRALVVMHDQEGHPLLVTTLSFDQHLKLGLKALLTSYEQAAGLSRVERVVVDRGGMAAEFLASTRQRRTHRSECAANRSVCRSGVVPGGGRVCPLAR